MAPCPGLYPTREPQLGSPTLLRSSQAIGALVVALALLLSAALNAGAAPLAPHSPALLVESNPVYYDVPLTPVVEQEADYRIAITELGFEPAVLAVPPAAVVEWVNADVQGHSATYLPDGGQAASRQAAGQNSGITVVEAQESQSLYLPALQK